jgi:hypothetical protein
MRTAISFYQSFGSSAAELAIKKTAPMSLKQLLAKRNETPMSSRIVAMVASKSHTAY